MKTRIASLLFALLGAAAAAAAIADGHGGHRGGDERRAAPPAGREAPRGYAFDHRWNHDHYYPRVGLTFNAPPPGGAALRWRGDPYYYAGGVWYRPWGPRYRVIVPPIGIGIAVLPAWYTTVWFGGIPYYYADGSYYLWEPARREYVVTAPPAGEAAAGTEAPGRADLYAYPRNGQGEEQQSRDRYECHQWATQQSGFDPTQPLGGVAAGEAPAKRADYQRAERACLEGRGYSVN